MNNIVLNLVINGIPSIHSKKESAKNGYMVLNLVINGIPSILMESVLSKDNVNEVLNLVINGIPSIQSKVWIESYLLKCFKPCYKWNTFNTLEDFKILHGMEMF